MRDLSLLVSSSLRLDLMLSAATLRILYLCCEAPTNEDALNIIHVILNIGGLQHRLYTPD